MKTVGLQSPDQREFCPRPGWRASPSIRRLMNQAVFEVVWVDTDENQVINTRTKLASPFADVLSLRDELAQAGAYEDDKAPDPLVGSEALVVGSITTEQMIGETGFEPATARPPGTRTGGRSVRLTCCQAG
jgi:hypothetical protein